MEFFKKTAQVFVKNNLEINAAFKRTTSVAIAAHEDDVEIMAFKGVLEARKSPDEYFTVLICTDGTGGAYEGKFADFSKSEMKNIRKEEQMKAALTGGYNALVMLDYESCEIKEKRSDNLFSDFHKVFENSSIKTVYTHNPTDSHDTHTAVCVKTIQFLRSLKAEKRPERVYGCEVWRSLDWLLDEDKTCFDVSGNDELFKRLMDCFESQNQSKSYYSGTMGRFCANGVFSKERSDKISLALDLTPLIASNADIADFACSYIDRFSKSVREKLNKYL